MLRGLYKLTKEALMTSMTQRLQLSKLSGETLDVVWRYTLISIYRAACTCRKPAWSSCQSTPGAAQLRYAAQIGAIVGKVQEVD